MYKNEIKNMIDALSKAGVINDKEKAADVLCEYWSDQIADVWHVVDVMESMGDKHPQMTESDAKKILWSVHNNANAELGINWSTIEHETDWYFENSTG